MFVNDSHILFKTKIKQIMKIKLFGHPFKTRAYGTVSVQKGVRKVVPIRPIESSVRPNGTSVIPVLRSRKTIMFFYLKNHEHQTFRASLENWGPRDRVCVKEREKMYRSHRSRGLYDQMTPQLYQFYVPEKPTKNIFEKS